jgi:hypothetical protein
VLGTRELVLGTRELVLNTTKGAVVATANILICWAQALLHKGACAEHDKEYCAHIHLNFMHDWEFWCDCNS